MPKWPAGLLSASLLAAPFCNTRFATLTAPLSLRHSPRARSAASFASDWHTPHHARQRLTRGTPQTGRITHSLKKGVLNWRVAVSYRARCVFAAVRFAAVQGANCSTQADCAFSSPGDEKEYCYLGLGEPAEKQRCVTYPNPLLQCQADLAKVNQNYAAVRSIFVQVTYRDVPGYVHPYPGDPSWARCAPTMMIKQLHPSHRIVFYASAEPHERCLLSRSVMTNGRALAASGGAAPSAAGLPRGVAAANAPGRR